LASLDALRGFDMFWLLGGQQLVAVFCKSAPPDTWRHAFQRQFEHVPWEGFRFYDFIFPLFLFLIGVAVPLSVEKRRAKGDTPARILRHALLRTGAMTLLGFVTTGNLLSWSVPEMRLSYSVLMMLGWGYLLATVLVLYASRRVQLATTAGILLGYWVLQKWLPYPGVPIGPFAPGALFGDWLYDVTVGRLDKPWASPYGRGFPLWMWNVGANTMLGVFACYLLRPSGAALQDRTPALARLAGTGVLCLVAGWLWSLHLPIVKDAWTSSFVLWACGWAYLLLALFHWIIDRRGWTRWAGLFQAIGCNSILAYLIATTFMSPFHSLATRLFGGLKPHWPELPLALLLTLTAYGSVWALLAYLRRQRILLRL
jgi:predicted acyltransferase